MFEQVQLARTFLRMAWLHRWTGMVAAGLLSVLGWGFVQSLPDTYEVRAKIFLDSRSMLRPLLSGIAFNTGAAGDAALLLSRTLLTRPNLEEVARRADLDLQTETPEEFSKLVDSLATDIKITTGRRGGNVYDIAYSDRDAKTAKRVVDELLNIFLEQSLGDARRDTASTQKFLDEQIAAYEKRLVEAEDRLKQFKQRNVGVMPGSQGGFFARMQEAQAALNEAELKLEEARRRRDLLKRESTQAAPAATSSVDGAGKVQLDRRRFPQLAVYDSKISDLQGRIDEMLLKYTEKHPDIIAMQRLIEEYTRRREEKAAELLANPEAPIVTPDGQVVESPFNQQIKLEAAQAEATVGALETRVAEYRARLQALARKVDVVPEIEADLARLNRDYGITRKQYNELLERRELMKVGLEAEQSVDEVKIKVLEPTRLPLDPTGPPRILLGTVVLVLALGAGAAVSVIQSQLNPRLIDVPDVKGLTGLPVLGVISMVSNVAHRQQRRLELIAFFSVLSGLVGIYAAQITLDLLGFDLHARVVALLGVAA